MPMSVRAMAQALGVGKSQVQRDAAAGMPMSDPAAARAWREAHHDVSRTAHGRIDRHAISASTAALLQAAADTAPPPAEDEAPRPDDTAAYREARTARERIRRDREQLELDQLRGNLIGLDDAKRLAFTAFRSLRDAVLNVPARVKDQCAAATDPIAIERLIEDELNAALGRFSADRVLHETADEEEEATA